MGERGVVKKKRRLLSHNSSEYRTTSYVMKTCDNNIKCAFQTLCENRNAQFRPVEQEEAVNASTMVEGDHVIILSTWSGNSMMFVIRALLNCDKLIFLFVSLVALKEYILRRCQHWGLDDATWESRHAFRTLIVVVFMEYV